MEALFTQIVNAILAVGGAGAIVISLLLMVIVFLWRELRASEKARREEADACEKSKEALFEKRLEESKSVLVALGSNTASTAALSASVEARSAILTELAKALQAMATQQELTKGYFTEAVRRIEDRLSSIESRERRDRDRDRDRA